MNTIETTDLPAAKPMHAARFHTEAFKTDEERTAAARLPPVRRQWMIKNLIVRYPVFNEGFEMIARNHYPVDGGDHGTGTVGALLGESRAGKTAICSFYTAMKPPHHDDEGEIFPVIHLTASLRMTQVEFAHELNRLTAARATRLNGGIGAYVNNALLRLPRVRNQLLIIDDAHYLFFEQPSNGAAKMFKLVKTIADYNTCAVMLVGEERINDYVYSIDAFANRSYNSQVLRPLSAGKDDMQRFAMLMRGIDRRLPFVDLSGLDAPELVRDFYRYSDGMIGRVMNLIRPAAFLAINDGSSRILVEHLRRAVSTRMRKNDNNNYFGVSRNAA